jgi:hypothetical protein
MATESVTISLPAGVYAELEALARREDSSPAETIARLVAHAKQQRAGHQDNDPVLALVGAHRSQRALIDGIPVSEDPDLYWLSAELGERAGGRHAWEIAPHRYRQGPDGRPVRHDSTE